MNKYNTLNELPLGEEGMVYKLLSQGAERTRLMDLGLVNRAPILPLQKSPLGDPTAFLIKGCVIALREEDMKKILVSRREKEAQG